MKHSKIVSALMLTACVTVLAACGSSNGNSSPSGGTSTTVDTESSESNSESSAGATIYNIQNYIHPYVAAVTDGVNEEAAKLGIKVEYSNANGDLNAQISQIDNAIAAGAKGIVIQPVDSMAVIPAIDRATSAGLCVVAVTVPIGSKTGAVYSGTKGFVGWDETISGSTVGKGLVQAIGESGGIAILAGDLTNGATAARVEGLKAEFGKYSNIKLLDVQQHHFDTDQARSLALAMVSKYGSDLKALYVDTNPAAVAVANALKGQGIAIGSIGGMSAYLDLIKSGDATLDVPEAPTAEGLMATKLVSDCISGDTSPTFLPETDLPALQGIKSNDYVVTKDNLSDFTPDW